MKSNHLVPNHLVPNHLVPCVRKGFTLIELLVVITIIAILVATIMISLNTARAKARDKQRKSDLAMIKNAVEMYYSSKHFMPPGPGPDGGIACYPSNGTGWDALFASGELGQYINAPEDPINDSDFFYVYKKVSSSSYFLFANLENNQDSESDTSVNQDSSGASYCPGIPGFNQFDYRLSG